MWGEGGGFGVGEEGLRKDVANSRFFRRQLWGNCWAWLRSAHGQPTLRKPHRALALDFIDVPAMHKQSKGRRG